MLSALEDFKCSTNKVEAATAKGFLLQLKQFDVVFVLQFLGEILEYTNKVSLTLQKEDLLMSSAKKVIDGLKRLLKSKRSESFFYECWKEACSVAEKAEIQTFNDDASKMNPTRKTKTPIKYDDSILMTTTGQRTNSSGKMPFKQMLFEVLDHMIGEIERRFTTNQAVFKAFEVLNPASTDCTACLSIQKT